MLSYVGCVMLDMTVDGYGIEICDMYVRLWYMYILMLCDAPVYNICASLESECM